MSDDHLNTSGALAAAAHAVASGDPVDWPVLSGNGADARSQRELLALEGIASIAAFHRGWQGSTSDSTSAAQEWHAWGTLNVIRELGRGSFGTVYLAHDPRLNRDVALKILDDRFGSDVRVATTIIEEGRHLARLRHPNIVAIHSAQLVDGRIGLEMELVQGRSLKEIVQTDGPLGPEEAAIVGRDVCRALAAVHAAGLVHRDVTSQNILRERGGRIVLMDFGAGRTVDATDSEAITGTPLYLAPELFAGATANAQTDLYSLGVLLFHLVTGAFPVQANTIDELREAHVQRRAIRLRDIRPDLPQSFIHVVEHALAADPPARIGSAGRLEAELTEMLGRADGPARPRRQRWPALAIAAAIVTVAAAALWWRGTTPRETASVSAERSIAVLPFVNRSADGADEYFADGMTDQLIASLGKVPGLRVAARTSAFTFNGQPREARDVARRLGVDTLLEGTVQRVGRRLRVTVSLIGGSDGLQRWSSTIDDPVGDVFAVQDAIARAVVNDLSLQLGDAALRAMQAGRTKDLEAHDLYLRGLASMSLSTESGLRRAIDFYQRAIARDPQFALAYTGIALANTFLADAYVPANEAYPAARTAAQEAIARDDLVADAHAVLGYAGFGVDWNPFTAEQEYRRALAIDPNSAAGHEFFGTYLCGTGSLDEALLHLRRAMQLDPLSPLAAWMVEWCGYMRQRHQDVIEAHQHTESIAPGFWYQDSLVGAAYRELGNYPAALREYGTAAHALNGAPQYGLAITYARMGRVSEAQEIMHQLDALANRQYVPFLYRAALHGALGEMDAGVALLQRSFDLRELLMVGVPKVELRELLTDSRARAIIDEAEAIWHRREVGVRLRIHQIQNPA